RGSPKSALAVAAPLLQSQTSDLWAARVSSRRAAVSDSVGVRHSKGSPVRHPADGSQVPHGSHGSGGPPRQLPPWHESSVVHRSPSWHAVPSGADRQADEQQSPSVVFPSSHSSPMST